MTKAKHKPIDRLALVHLISFDMAADLCGWLSEGKSLTSWVSLPRLEKEYGFQPNAVMVYSWLQKQDWFRDMYNDAKENRADTLADEIIEIADDAASDVYISYDKQGNPVAKIDGNAINRARLQVDARKWVASVMKPKQYGQKVDVTSKGDHVADGKKSKDKTAAASKASELIEKARARIRGEVDPRPVDPFS